MRCIKLKHKTLLMIIFSMILLVPTLAEAGSFGGSSSRTSSISTSRSISLSKPSTSTTTKSFSGSTSTTKPSTSTTTKSGSFSGSTSTKSPTSSTTTKSGSFSGATSTKTSTYKSGTVYKSTPTRTYYNGRYVSVSNHYSAGYSPYGAFHYFAGFSTGMMLSSLFHPFGNVYPVGGSLVSYGVSPLSIIVDIIVLIILIVIGVAIWKALRPSKVIYNRRF